MAAHVGDAGRRVNSRDNRRQIRPGRGKLERHKRAIAGRWATRRKHGAAVSRPSPRADRRGRRARPHRAADPCLRAEAGVGAATSARLIAGTTCPVTPEQTEGPFYFDPALVRRDDCGGQGRRAASPQAADRRRRRLRAVAGGRGSTSGIATRPASIRAMTGERIGRRSAGCAAPSSPMRRGWSTFEPSIRAGTRAGRRTSTSRPGCRTAARSTSQLYFPDACPTRIYAGGPYAGRGGRRLRNGDDFIFSRPAAACRSSRRRPRRAAMTARS